MNAKNKSTLLLYGIVIFQQLLSAFAFPIFKIGLNEIEPFSYAFLRFTLSALVYLPFLIYLRKKKDMPWKDHFRVLVIGIIIILFNQVAYLYGQSLTLAGHSALLFATIPIFIYILAIFFLKEKATLKKSIGIFIAAVGVFVIIIGGGIELGSEYLWGDLIVLGAVVAWAVAAILMKPLAVKYGAFRITGLALAYGSVIYFPFGLYRALKFDYSGVTIYGWLSIFYVAIIVSIAAYVLWYWLLKQMEASRLAIAQNIQPIVATMVAAIVLSEPITQNFVIGGLIVIGGVLITEI